jgi:hypothetical protein
MANKRTSATVPLGQQAILAGGFIWSLDESVTFNIKVQQQTNTNPDQWVTVHEIPPFSAAVTEGLSTDYQTVYGQLIQWEPSEIGQYRWHIELSSASRTAKDRVYFAVIERDAPRPEGGVLELVSAHPDTGITLNYIAGVNFDHGTLTITNAGTGGITEQTGYAGVNVVTGLELGVWYYFQMQAFNIKDDLGGVSNIVSAYLKRHVVIPPESPLTPFHEIVIKNNPLGGTLVTWGLGRSFCDPGPYLFELQWAETTNGTWETVQTGPISDTYFAVDETRRLFAKEIESYYRVIMTTGTTTYISYAKGANSFWSKRDWLLGREICRKERLLAKKFVGWEGYLLKRKIWGPKCPRCADFDTDEVNESCCTICFGTGVVGGYWEGYPTFVYNMEGGPTQFKEFEDNTNMKEDVMMQNMRILAYPHISTNDIFVHTGSGRRYFVRPVKVGATVKGVPIIYRVTLALIPYTDPAYTVPITPVPPEPYDEVPEEPDTPALPTPEEPADAPFYIFWWRKEWYLGPVIGEPISSLYRTESGYPIADGLDSYSWVPVTGDSTMTVEEAPNKTYDVTVAGDSDVSGVYAETDSEHMGLSVFVKT